MKAGDENIIADLLSQLGYPDTGDFIFEKMQSLLNDPAEYLTVAENAEGKAIALISVHIIQQIALKGGFARISYFSVDENSRSSGIGKQLEEYCEKRNCDRIELHCNFKREKAHQFYYRQGCTESPKYLMKKL